MLDRHRNIVEKKYFCQNHSASQGYMSGGHLQTTRRLLRRSVCLVFLRRGPIYTQEQAKGTAPTALSQRSKS